MYRFADKTKTYKCLIPKKFQRRCMYSYSHNLFCILSPRPLNSAKLKCSSKTFQLCMLGCSFSDVLILTPLSSSELSLDKTFVLFWGAYHVVSTVPYPLQGSQVTITPEKTLKRGFVCAHFSLHDPLSLSLSSQSVFSFRFLQY